jgi:hypothetical protein
MDKPTLQLAVEMAAVAFRVYMRQENTPTPSSFEFI